MEMLDLGRTKVNTGLNELMKVIVIFVTLLLIFKMFLQGAPGWLGG